MTSAYVRGLALTASVLCGCPSSSSQSDAGSTAGGGASTTTAGTGAGTDGHGHALDAAIADGSVSAGQDATTGTAGTSSSAGAGADAGVANNDLDAGPCPTFDAAFIDSLRGCSTDADCKAVTYQVNCCGTQAAVGLASAQVARFLQCAPDPTGFPACGCATQPTRADDGRTSDQFDSSNLGAHCVSGQCRSEVTQRACGTKPITCSKGTLCVTFQTNIGPSQSLDYECLDNPCTDTLDCACAAAVCATRTDVTRSCSLGYSEDVVCNDPRL